MDFLSDLADSDWKGMPQSPPPPLPVLHSGGRRRPASEKPIPHYDLVFRDNLYVGACGARMPAMRAFRARGIEPDLYVLKSRDYAKQRNRIKLKPIPGGTNPLFIDLQDLPERRDSILSYMEPVLDRQATSVARQLHAGRRVYINCRLGRNRSAMFAMAVVVAYQRTYEGKPNYTASQALALLTQKRQLVPHDWMMEGFRMMGYEPPLSLEEQRRERRPPQRLSLTKW